jgi:hypothetical protein
MKMEENQIESKKLEEQIERITKLDDEQHREIFIEMKITRIENQEQSKNIMNEIELKASEVIQESKTIERKIEEQQGMVMAEMSKK